MLTKYSSADQGREINARIDYLSERYSIMLGGTHKNTKDLAAGGDEGKLTPTGWDEKDLFERGRCKLTKRLYERGIQADFDSYINAGRHERVDKRRGLRNGYRGRSLLTRDGLLDLKVPRDREGQYKPTVFKRYKRVERVVEDGIRAMFLSKRRIDPQGGRYFGCAIRRASLGQLCFPDQQGT